MAKKNVYSHKPIQGRKALTYGASQGFGPMLNTRHPKKFKWTAPEKKTAASSAKADDGKVEHVDHDVSVSSLPEKEGICKHGR